MNRSKKKRKEKISQESITKCYFLLWSHAHVLMNSSDSELTVMSECELSLSHICIHLNFTFVVWR